MKHLARPSLLVGLGVVIGAGMSWLFFKAAKYEKEAGIKDDSWFVSTTVNMGIISDALSAYVNTNKTSEPISLETLVHAKLLPEWSEIYICPEQFGLEPLRTNYDESFRANIFAPSPLAARYSSGSYYIETLSKSYRVRCLYYTNVLDCTVPMSEKTAGK
jgi:hypothetical protein